MTYVIQKDQTSEKWIVRVYLDGTLTQYGATVFCKDQDEAERAFAMLTGDQTVKLQLPGESDAA